MKPIFKAADATRKALSNTASIKTQQFARDGYHNAGKLFAEVREDVRRVESENKQRLENEHKQNRALVIKQAMIANKRVKRLEEQGLELVPAYRAAFRENSQKFGVRGLRGNKEVMRELERIDKFINAQTSTLRGAKKYLDGIAAKRGETIPKGEHTRFAIQYSNMFRAHEKLAALRPVELSYSSDNEMEALNSIIEELDDGYRYSADEIEAVVELAIEEQEQAVELKGSRRQQGIAKLSPVVFSTNKADPIGLDW